jgi:hypothetical protein
MGAPCEDPLDPPYALDPLTTAMSITMPPTAAINRNLFTTLLLPSCLPTIRSAGDGAVPVLTNR